ncbi:MAG: DUF4296 domain-containing protein [Bacteroidia bacterium]|nr:MAG: DUF4296 domain-containing protein [Bacteroidia bacterium]
MNRYILLVLIAFSVTAALCTSRKSKTEHKDIIPEKDLTSILTDVYIADGLLSIPEIRYKFTEGDTLDSYIDIIERHGYSKILMDNTMKYYFVSKPKKLIKIYDKVLGQLSEIDSRVDKDLQSFGVRQTNIWPGEQSYSFCGTSNKDTSWIDFSSDFNGTLALKFTLTIFPDDQSADPVLGLYFSQTDSAGNEKRVSFPPVPFIKDGHPCIYNISLVQNLPGIVRMKGWCIDPQYSSPLRDHHYWVNNIVLTRTRIE